MAVTPLVGFVGLGDMGEPMAASLLRAGVEVVAYDTRPDALRQLMDQGARGAESCRDVAQQADVLCVCVLNDEQVMEVVFGPDGLTSVDSERTLVVHSTVTPQTMQALETRLSESGWQVVGAQVSGGHAVAAKGELTLMVSGPEAAVDDYRTVFDAMGGNVFYLGSDAHLGAVAKLCNNLMANVANLATIEAAKLGRAYGLDEQKLMEIACVSTGGSWWTQNWGFTDNLLRTHRLAGGFGVLDLFTKDFWEAIEAGRAQGISLPLTAAAGGAGPTILSDRLRDE